MFQPDKVTLKSQLTVCYQCNVLWQQLIGLGNHKTFRNVIIAMHLELFMKVITVEISTLFVNIPQILLSIPLLNEKLCQLRVVPPNTDVFLQRL